MKDILIVESKEDKLKFQKWILDGVNSSNVTDSNHEQLASNLFNKFLELKSRIKSPYNDFYYWMKDSTFEDFFRYIVQLSTEVDKSNTIRQKEKEGAELVYKDDTWKVYHIINYEASAKYGKGTKWCITGTKRWNNGDSGESTFLNYHNENGVEFYFYIKNNGEKYALAIYPDNQHYEIYNAEDVKVPYIEDAPSIEGLPDVSTKDDMRTLVNAIMTGQIEEKTIFYCMQLVALENRGVDLYITTNPNVIASWFSDQIPDGYLEFEAVKNGDLTPEEYESITGNEWDDVEYWDGDYPYLEWGAIDSIKGITKKEKCNPDNFKDYKYWAFYNIEGNGYDINYANDYVGLYMMIDDIAIGSRDWPDSELDDFYGNNQGSRMDVLAIMIANTLINQIKEGRISKDVLKDLDISNELFEESLQEDATQVSNDFANVEVSLPYKNEKTIIDTFIKLGAKKGISREGPTLVFRDGTCLNLEAWGTHGEACFEVGKKLGFPRRNNDENDDEYLEYLEFHKGTITLNGGNWDFEDRIKIVMDAKPSEYQYTRIKEFLDLMMQGATSHDTLYIYAPNGFQTYCLIDYDSSDIIMKIRRAFTLGRLEENTLKEAKAITWGDLDYAKKTDTRGIQMSGRGTGHFGTGFYFVGKDGPYGLDSEGNIKKYDYEPSRPIYEIDLDAYNLFKPRDNDSAYKIHDAMREINNGYEPSLVDWLYKDFDIDKLEDELFQIGWDAQDVNEDIDDDLDLDIDDLEDLVDDKEELSDEELDRRYEENYRKGVKEFIKKYGLEEYVWKDIDTEKIGVVENHIKDAIHSKYNSIQGLKYALKVLSQELNVNKDRLLGIIKQSYDNTNSKDTISTQIFKALGYEGVDVTHLNHDAQGLSGLDNFSYGTVIYDLKPGTFRKIKEPRKTNSGYYKDTTNEDLSLNEIMRGKGSVSDSRILQYVEECIDTMKGLSFGFVNEDCLSYDDIDVEEGDTTRTFGTMLMPKTPDDNFKLVLNKHMFDEPEEAIKNTILHELCHYVVDKVAIDRDVVTYKNGGWYLRTNLPFANELKGHGNVWKKVASKVGDATGQDITRLGSYDVHTGVGQHAKDVAKYVIQCKNCGRQICYNRRTKFINAVIDGNGHTNSWWHNCPDGKECHDFEIVKGI